ncbi:hypothetical protein TrLO_g382 [Triparma laevis f. longispina]|uniref:Purple acid phosphatase n=1 Tax=Triparma laevis f. longispina TaxID=1714387 RepID=A0A9W7CGI2_9STRA|nr:hypothetical protein TrLO_g382 [Triparma laevis f. longispina]
MKFTPLALLTLTLPSSTTSLLLSSAPAGTPSQVHTSYISPTSVAVSWTARPSTPCIKPVVNFGDDEIVDAVTENYDGSDDSMYSAVLDKLIPGETYSYTVGCSDYSTYSTDDFSFTVAPPEDDTSGFEFIAFGDMGVSAAAKAATANMAKDVDGKDFIFHNGDISYACGKDDVWDTWFDQVQPLQQNNIYMTSPGNHDLLPSDSAGENGIPYTKRFKMPQQYLPDDPEDAVLYYSWVHKYVTMVVLSTDTDYFEGTPQYKWLEETLATVRTPWTIVAGHKNLYCSSTYGNNERSPDGTRGNAGSLTNSLEPLFDKYNVDVFLGGHIHAYERTYPVNTNGTFTDHDSVSVNEDGVEVYTNPSATTYLVLGMAGAGHLGEEWPEPEWSAQHFEEYGYARFEFTNSSAMKMEFVANGNEDDMGDGPIVRDSMWIVKD